jgi:hypothetical protein
MVRHDSGCRKAQGLATIGVPRSKQGLERERSSVHGTEEKRTQGALPLVLVAVLGARVAQAGGRQEIGRPRPSTSPPGPVHHVPPYPLTLHLSSRGLSVLLIYSAFCVANLSVFYLPISLFPSLSISIATFPFPFPFPQSLSSLSLILVNPRA